jgi:hypothetical protein
MPEASILSLYGASQDAREQLVVTYVRDTEGRQSVRSAWLGHVKRPIIRQLAHGNSQRGGRPKRSGRFRRGIAERGKGHMKGVESIYMSGQMAIEAGSAG